MLGCQNSILFESIGKIFLATFNFQQFFYIVKKFLKD